MHERNIHGARRRKGFKTTIRDRDTRPAPDLVDRKFTATAPDQLWVADITYIPTWAGFLFLAVVLDVFSRRVVGWAMATHLRTELVLNALNMAIYQRKPTSVIHHSDQGCQYTAIAFGKRCDEVGVRPSMGSVGDCYDNAMCESFNATLECELPVKQAFRNQRPSRTCCLRFHRGVLQPAPPPHVARNALTHGVRTPHDSGGLMSKSHTLRESGPAPHCGGLDLYPTHRA